MERMRALSARYPRYGYRRVRIFLARDGHPMSPGRAYRLWRPGGLQVPRKRGRKRVAVSRPRPQAPTGPNQVWSYDFVFDRSANGQQLKCLTVTDEFTKEGLAIDVDGRIRSPRVIEVLSRLVSERGAPAFLRSDNGPEFVSRAMLRWIVEQGIETALIEPGKPWRNGVAESFNGKFRDECLSLERFRSRAEAKVVIEQWWRHYNDVRPHSSLGYLTPAAFAAHLRPLHAAGTVDRLLPARCTRAIATGPTCTAGPTVSRPPGSAGSRTQAAGEQRRNTDDLTQRGNAMRYAPDMELSHAVPRARRFGHSLYLQVLAGVALGVLIGWLWPDAAMLFKPLGDAFIRLVRMMIVPVVFCTIVTGIAGVGQDTKVGPTLLKTFRLFCVLTTPP